MVLMLDNSRLPVVNNMNFKTEQEKFWAGSFGNEYIDRFDNKREKWLAANAASFEKIFSYTEGIRSIIEFGAGIGANLTAIKKIIPAAELSAVDINKKAAVALRQNQNIKNVYHQSILDFWPERAWDMAFTKGVLIHINPDHLSEAYKTLYDSSNRYILISKYYNPTPIEINYRGHRDRLFKRDFAGEILEQYPDLRLVNYGFEYHRDNNYCFDDLNWFLLEK